MKRVSIKPEDRWFSFCVRQRAHWACERCGRSYPIPSPPKTEGAYPRGASSGLHCSHFIDRRFKPTRWHPFNCNALCMGCHEHLGKSEDMYRQWLTSLYPVRSYWRSRSRGESDGAFHWRPAHSDRRTREDLDNLFILSRTSFKNSAWIRAVIAAHYKAAYKRMVAEGASEFTNWTEGPYKAKCPKLGTAQQGLVLT